MLKVQINKNEFKSDLVNIAYSDIETEIMEVEYETGEGTVTYSPNKEALIVTCFHDDGIEVREGDTIVGMYSAEDSEGVTITTTQRFIVSGVDDAEHSFSFLGNRYTDLGAVSFAYGKTTDYLGADEDTGEDMYRNGAYLFLYLGKFHYINAEEYQNGAPLFFLNEDGSDFELVCEPYGDKCVRLPLDELESIDCSGVYGDDADFCQARADEVTEYNNGVVQNQVVAMLIFKYYGIIENSEDDWDEVYEKLFEDDTMSGELSASPFQIRQYNPMFLDISDPDRLGIYVVRPNVSISIPLRSKFSTDLNQETNVNEKFVEVEKKKAINPYTEMEKDVYSPKCKVNGELERVTELHFNLHFRKRVGDDWKTERNGTWNGVMESGSETLMNMSNDSMYGFFSYEDKSMQSDLLEYLGFSDGDVKYRKNTLKKSFLRLSYFDSTMSTNQNLLGYATVFVDTGNLFSKYMRNFDNPKRPNDSFGYSRVLKNGETKVNLSGGRVNREPYWAIYDDDENDVESLRLSSQFVVKDKYSSDSCSEGFYLYLWKDYNNGNVPSDIYMRVEFNHAGFGRTIPFMMPYDKSDGAIKDFKTVAEDNGYGVKEYIRYSYIHFKYMQDSDGMYVYYLDDDQYKSNISFKDGVLSLNLYEAKLSDEGD